MAKLEGVKILDAVNGEVFKVEYDEEVYERVTDGKAQEGDLINVFNYGFWHVDTSAYYSAVEEDGKVSIVDDGGVFRWGPLSNGDDWNVYRKQSPKTSSTSTPKLQAYVQTDVPQVGGYVVFDENGPDITAGRHYEITRIDGDGDPIFEDDTGDDRWRANIHSRKYYEKVGEPNGIYMVKSEDIAEDSPQPLFAKVNRPGGKPIEGDYVEFTDIDWMIEYVTAGKKYEVFMEDGVLSFLDDDGDDFDVIDEDDDWKVGTIYVKYTQEQAEQKAKVGDKILIVDVHPAEDHFEKGDVLTVTRASIFGGDGVYVDNPNESFAVPEEFIVLTPQQYGETQAELVAEDANKEEPVTTANISEGDYVIAKSNNNGYLITVADAGAMKVVGKVGGSFIEVELLTDHDTGPVGETFTVEVGKFRHATQDEIAKALGIDNVQVGDKVEVLAEDHFVLNKGEVVTVDKIEEDDNGDWRVKVRGWIALYAFHHVKPRFKVVEKAAEKVAEQPTVSIEKGDLVQVVDSPIALPNGSVFRVHKVRNDGGIEDSSRNHFGYRPKHVKLIAKARDVYV